MNNPDESWDFFLRESSNYTSNDQINIYCNNIYVFVYLNIILIPIVIKMI
ncbi:hypothetical protein SAMN06265171_1152 [Chryseobacterium rhizoplanae]|uniref:Uncharacterized protein n=1 Tax=Chryseobacterium rhizoplanae TaxID=1609531 RepID=A0A521FHC2_9FLAO|nr:hypothetical protein SAMN06265171_1152 [Chryseobacterium rhizoplanae]